MRKTKLLTIDVEGRDKGKTFLLTEMSARRVERWATQVFMLLMRSGVAVPEEQVALGLAGLASIGIKMLSGVPTIEAQGLLDEMLECVEILPDEKNPNVRRGLIDEDVEEPATYWRMRVEIFALHTGFFSYADLLTWVSARGQEALRNISTSRE